MAVPAKEANVIILDVGKSMTQGSASKLEGAIKATSLLIQQKLLHSTKDEVGVVLFGTKKTQNHLAETSEGYEHITVLRDIVIPDLPLLKAIENIKGEGAKGDMFSALIVGMDLLLRKTNNKKYLKRIFLITDAGSPTNKDDLPIVLEKIKQMDAKINVIGVDFDVNEGVENDEDEDSKGQATAAQPKVFRSKTKVENEKTLLDMTSNGVGVVITVSRALELMSVLRGKSVLQRTTYRGQLEISEHLSIPVWSYLKTMPRTFPTMKKLSALAFEGDEEGGEGGEADHLRGEVRMQRTYHPITDPDTEVLPDDRVKGYKYGRTLVPFSEVDAQILQYKAPKCMQVIGFTLQSNVPRQHFIGNAECIVPEPGDEHAAVALAALVRAMLETESVAIIRYVKRNNSVPHLGVLVPYIHYSSEIRSDWECFYYIKLPFAEDLRQYPFASLDPSRARKSFVPSPEQLSVAEKLINSLDLMTAVKEEDDDEPTEALKPKQTFNPVLQHFYQCVQKRAMNPKAPIPPLDPDIHVYVNPDAELFSKAADSLAEFKKTFPLVPVNAEEDNKKRRRFWRDAFDTADVTLDSYIPDPKKPNKAGDKLSIDKIFSGGTTEVGSVKPVQDFKDMISRRDVDLVSQACKQMEERILQLVNDSVGSQLYPKAIECLVALRAGCVKEEEAEEWNNFLKKLKTVCEGKRRADFWYELVKRMITLIDYDESDDSTVSPDEAKAFLLTADEETSNEPTDTGKSAGDDTDDLFDMVE